MSIHSYGTTLEYSTNSGGNWTTVTEVRSIDWDGAAITQANGSSLTSLNAAMTFDQGMIDPGTLSFTAHYVPAELAVLWTLRRTPGVLWRVTYPDGTADVFEGNIQRIGRTVPEDDDIVVPFEIKLSGLPSTFAA